MNYQHFEPFLKVGSKVSKKCKCDLNVFFTKFGHGCQKNAEFYADFETVEKNAKKIC
jgi:hypothetical protein